MSPGDLEALEQARRCVLAVLEAAGVRLPLPQPDAPGRWRAAGDRVELLDLASRDVRRIATTSWPAGQTDLVRTDGGWVLWEDLERTPSTDASRSLTSISLRRSDWM